MRPAAIVARERRVPFVPDLQAALVPEHVGVDVVAVAGLAGVDNRAKRARRELKRERRRVPIAERSELPSARPEGSTCSPHLFNFHPGEESRHVDVVDRHVYKLAAAALEVFRRRGIRIVADRALRHLT